MHFIYFFFNFVSVIMGVMRYHGNKVRLSELQKLKLTYNKPKKFPGHGYHNVVYS